MDDNSLITDSTVRKAGNMYFPVAKLVESADKYLEGKAALKALNFFTGMPVDDLLAELANKKLKQEAGGIEFGKRAIDDFLSEMCVFGDQYQENAITLYNSFCTWCRNNGIMKLISQKKFGTIVSASFDKIKSGLVYYQGLALKSEEKAA